MTRWRTRLALGAGILIGAVAWESVTLALADYPAEYGGAWGALAAGPIITVPGARYGEACYWLLGDTMALPAKERTPAMCGDLPASERVTFPSLFGPVVGGYGIPARGPVGWSSAGLTQPVVQIRTTPQKPDIEIPISPALNTPAPIPLPWTLPMMAAGMAGIAAIGRRK